MKLTNLTMISSTQAAMARVGNIRNMKGGGGTPSMAPPPVQQAVAAPTIDNSEEVAAKKKSELEAQKRSQGLSATKEVEGTGIPLGEEVTQKKTLLGA